MENDAIMKSLAARKLIRRIAEGLKLTTQAVYAWDRVPAEKVVRVEEITGVPREELRPDLYERDAP